MARRSMAAFPEDIEAPHLWRSSLHLLLLSVCGHSDACAKSEEEEEEASSLSVQVTAVDASCHLLCKHVWITGGPQDLFKSS